MATTTDSPFLLSDMEAELLCAASMPLPNGTDSAESEASDAENEIGDQGDLIDSNDGEDTEVNSEDDGSDTCSTHSETSTVEYQQEPFETFQEKARLLAQQTIWPDAQSSDIEVERMAGGNFNRIIGLTLKTRDADAPDIKVVLRVPRDEDDGNDKDIATLRFVTQNTNIPVPAILYVDQSRENAIGSPFMFQARLKGVSLFTVWPELSHPQKLRVATELGHIIRTMLTIRNSVGGEIVLVANEEQADDATVRIAPFKFFSLADLQDPENKATPTIETTTDFQCTAESVPLLSDELLRVFNSILSDMRQRNPDSTWEEYEGMVQMVKVLSAEGWLEETFWCLNHLDFECRNIHIDPEAAENEPMITAVLDWDSAVIGPNFMSCRPPHWIWAWSDDDGKSQSSDPLDEDSEPTTYDEPDTSENQELKQAFEAAAGCGYAQYAYHPAYRLARRLFRFISTGITNMEVSESCERMLEEWAEAQDTWRADRRTSSDDDWEDSLEPTSP